MLFISYSQSCLFFSAGLFLVYRISGQTNFGVAKLPNGFQLFSLEEKEGFQIFPATLWGVYWLNGWKVAIKFNCRKWDLVEIVQGFS